MKFLDFILILSTCRKKDKYSGLLEDSIIQGRRHRRAERA